MTNVKQVENVEYFKYLGSVIKSDANLLLKRNPGLPRQKQKDSSYQKTGLKNLKKEQVYTHTNTHTDIQTKLLMVQKLENFGQ
jgi:hypothetical protein